MPVRPSHDLPLYRDPRSILSKEKPSGSRMHRPTSPASKAPRAECSVISKAPTGICIPHFDRIHFPVHKIALWLWLVCFAFGCVQIPRGFDSPEPAARMEAAVDAVARNDRKAIPDIIALLDSDDPATRMVAIRSLERLTGQTLGYSHAAPKADRLKAIDRWVNWQRKNADSLDESPHHE